MRPDLSDISGERNSLQLHVAAFTKLLVQMRLAYPSDIVSVPDGRLRLPIIARTASENVYERYTRYERTKGKESTGR